MSAAESGKAKKMHKLFKTGKLKNKEICLFGVSNNTRQIIKILRENGYDATYVIDNDASKIGSYFAGVAVTDAKEFKGSKNIICLLYSFYHEEMRRQLIQRGMNDKNIISLVDRERTIFEVIKDVNKGRKVYTRLIKEYGDIPIFLCPYSGTGDIYLIGTFWNEYIKKEKIENYIFVVISGACKKVAQLFGIKNIALLKNQKECAYLINYYSVNSEKVRLKILNDAWAQINDNPTEWFRGYKGWYFMELFRKFVFDLPEDSKPEHPILQDKEHEVSKIFDENGLIKGKTVVLSPYSNTLSELPIQFWENLCDILNKKGYTVCTNSSGESEPAIKGSVGVFFSLNIAPHFINAAGVFIGIRSGLCDIISGCNAKKIILYDKGNRFYNSSAFEYFNLKNMELCDDAIEIEFEHNENGIYKIIEDIGGELNG